MMTTETFDVVLAGNYLTTLVAALELAKAGKRVCVANPVPNWGGHFTRLTVGGMTFDPGAISHEFTAFNAEGARDPRDYDPRRRNDFGRFVNLIEEYTRSQVELVRMQAPTTVYGGALYRDIIMTNHLDVLHDPVLKARIHAEQEHIARHPSDDMHPRHKKTSGLFLKRSYYDVSVANHGATLHAAIFEPMFHKMSGLSTTRLTALYHRIAWLPLYYPQTLLSQFSGTPQVLQDTYFCYPKAGFMGVLGETLVQRMQEAGVIIVRDPIAHVEDGAGKSAVVLKDGRRLEARHLAWSLAHDQLVSAVTGAAPNNFERWSATLVFGTIERRLLKKDFSVLYAPDDRALFYRASCQTLSAGLDEDPARVVIEINPEYARAQGVVDEADVVARVQSDLVALGIIEVPQHLHSVGVRALKNVLLLPCTENNQLLANERDVLLDKYPHVMFTRNVDAFYTDTLNDQLIKGLKLAEQLKAA